jgi:chromosomal replication initiator protein
MMLEEVAASSAVLDAAEHESGPHVNAWDLALASIKATIGELKFDAWFSRLELVSLHNGIARLSAPTTFLCAWLRQHYSKIIWTAVAAAYPDCKVKDIAIELRVSRATQPNCKPQVEVEPPPIFFAQAVPAAPNDPLPHSGLLDSTKRFDTFAVGASNALAHAGLERMANRPHGTAPQFPLLYLHGDTGLGKTHLLQAFAAHRSAVGYAPLYLSIEAFLHHTAENIKFRDIDRHDCIIIDDLHFLLGSKGQLGLSRLISWARQDQVPVIVAANKPPLDINHFEPQLCSRLSDAFFVSISPPETALRHKIIETAIDIHRGEQPQFNVSQPVSDYLVESFPLNGRDLVGAINRIALLRSIGHEVETRETAETVLADLVRARTQKKILITDIQKAVADRYKITVCDILSSRRTAHIVLPRQIAMFLAKELTLRSLPEIGRRFGGRDHTTVLHAIRKIDAMVAKDKTIATDVDHLIHILRWELA